MPGKATTSGTLHPDSLAPAMPAVVGGGCRRLLTTKGCSRSRTPKCWTSRRPRSLFKRCRVAAGRCQQQLEAAAAAEVRCRDQRGTEHCCRSCRARKEAQQQQQRQQLLRRHQPGLIRAKQRLHQHQRQHLQWQRRSNQQQQQQVPRLPSTPCLRFLHPLTLSNGGS